MAFEIPLTIEDKIAVEDIVYIERKSDKEFRVGFDEKEAVVYNGFMYVSVSHESAFRKMCKDNFPDKDANEIHYRCLKGGDLAGKIMHGWYAPKFKALTWNEYYDG